MKGGRSKGGEAKKPESRSVFLQFLCCLVVYGVCGSVW